MNGARPVSSETLTIAEQPSVGTTRSQIALVPRTPKDNEFLYRVFASTRADEVALTGWPMEQQEQFLRMQFNAQTGSYAMQIPAAEHSIIQFCGEPVGRIIVERTPTEIHLVDIALLPQYRRRRIGGLLMTDLLTEAANSSRRIRLYVERYNPALDWYARIGFRVLQESQVYLEMIWLPERTTTNGSQA